MSLKNCYNYEDFRKLAKKKLPSPIFHYIDGGADDESTLRRNTDSFNDCDLVPNILASVGKPDLSTTLFGRKIDIPVFLSPAAMQRLYHPEGDKASARAAEKFGTFYSMSSMGNNTIEEVSNISSGPKLFQLYVHKDRSISDDLIGVEFCSAIKNVYAIAVGLSQTLYGLNDLKNPESAIFSQSLLEMSKFVNQFGL